MAEATWDSSRGWPVVRLSSDELVADVVPGLGGTITSLRRRRDNLELLWRTPWGLRPPYAQSLPGDAFTLRWQSDPGGWASLFPNVGDAVSLHGADWGEDGELRLAPFESEPTNTGLVLTTRLVRAPFTVRKTVNLEGGTIRVSETVHNVGPIPLETTWASRLLLGAPVLGPQTTIDVPATFVRPDPEVVYDASYDDLTPWPRSQGEIGMVNLTAVPPPDSNERRLVYLDELDAGQCSVANRELGLRLRLSWDLALWPYLTYELEAGRSSGFPHYGQGYFLRLQPGTSWPGKGLFDARRLSSATLWIEPREERRATIELRVTDLG